MVTVRTREHVDIIIGKLAGKPGAGIIFVEAHPDIAALRDGPRVD
jgi:hypothetical protein